MQPQELGKENSYLEKQESAGRGKEMMSKDED